MHIVVINLKRQPERRRHARSQLERFGLEFEFFDAIDGRRLRADARPRFDADQYRLDTLRDPLPTEIACFASHRAVWATCVQRTTPLLILEDDFVLHPGFADAIRIAESRLPEYGFLRFEECRRFVGPARVLRMRPQKMWSDNQFNVLYVCDVPLCALAYAITPLTALRLLRASATLTAPVDKFLQKTWRHGVPIYAIDPPVVCKSQLATESTIGKRQRKTLNPSILLRRAIHKWRNELRRHRFNRSQLRAGPRSTAQH